MRLKSLKIFKNKGMKEKVNFKIYDVINWETNKYNIHITSQEVR